MTKDEVLQGALALNGNDKKYTVTVKGDKIIIEARYSSLKRNATFRCVAHLNDDKTYVETHSAHDGTRSEFGKVAIAQMSISFSLGKKAISSSFNSKDTKKVLRDYLEACGYKRTNKGFFKKLFGR